MLVGFLILGFISGWKAENAYDSLKGLLLRERSLNYQEIPSEEFVVTTYNLWKQCGFGEVNKSQTIYVEGTGSINKAFLFQDLLKMNLCESIQSAANNCGAREDVTFTPADIVLPAIVKIECGSGNLLISS